MDSAELPTSVKAQAQAIANLARDIAEGRDVDPASAVKIIGQARELSDALEQARLDRQTSPGEAPGVGRVGLTHVNGGEECGGVTVSTIRHPRGHWETIVFGGEFNGRGDGCCLSEEEAERSHDEWVSLVRESLPEGESERG